SIRVDESAISHILKIIKKQLNIKVLNIEVKSVIVPEVEFTLKEFLASKIQETYGICQQKLQGEAILADQAAIITTLLLKSLYDFDLKVGQKHQGQYILLLLDNCSSYKTNGLVLQYINIHFLPLNITLKI
ncbi:LOW QUALITY PROTEIN: hypothetical protein BC936DRAFT_144378, partial [Jimgerdemannia flammicorona]